MNERLDFNAQIIDEFRSNGGKVAAFGDAPLVILATIGAKTGQLREIPLATMTDDEGTYVFASKAGAPSNPDWYHNLMTNPVIDVEEPEGTRRARLVELPVDEGQQKLRAQAELMPQFGDYITNAAPRLIPVFRIDGV